LYYAIIPTFTGIPVAEDFPAFWTADTGNLGGLMEEITFSSTASSAETVTVTH